MCRNGTLRQSPFFSVHHILSEGPDTHEGCVFEEDEITSDASHPSLMECTARALMMAIDDPGYQRLSAAPSQAAEEHALQALLVPWQQQELVLASTPPSVEMAGSDRLDMFASSEVPDITVLQYLERLKALFQCSDAVFVLALINVDRLLERCAVLKLEPRRLSRWNVHRVFLACLLVATKFIEDLVYANTHYAKAGGVTVRELNRLERFVLECLNYELRETGQYEIYEGMLRLIGMNPLSDCPPVLPDRSVDVPKVAPTQDEVPVATVVAPPPAVKSKPLRQDGRQPSQTKAAAPRKTSGSSAMCPSIRGRVQVVSPQRRSRRTTSPPRAPLAQPASRSTLRTPSPGDGLRAILRNQFGKQLVSAA
jgi:hypothetical protein